MGPPGQREYEWKEDKMEPGVTVTRFHAFARNKPVTVLGSQRRDRNINSYMCVQRKKGSLLFEQKKFLRKFFPSRHTGVRISTIVGPWEEHRVAFFFLLSVLNTSLYFFSYFKEIWIHLRNKYKRHEEQLSSIISMSRNSHINILQVHLYQWFCPTSSAKDQLVNIYRPYDL